MAETAIVFDTASTLAVVDNARTVPSHHLESGELSLTLEAYHMAPVGGAVSKARALHTFHMPTVSNALTLTAYHMAGVPSPITPSGDVSVSRAFSIPVFEAGEDVGGTVDFTVDS